MPGIDNGMESICFIVGGTGTQYNSLMRTISLYLSNNSNFKFIDNGKMYRKAIHCCMIYSCKIK